MNPVGAQIEQENGQDDHDQLVGEIMDETYGNEKALLLDPHTKLAAEHVLKVLSFSSFLLSPAVVSSRIYL